MCAQLCTALYATSRVDGGPQSLAPLFWGYEQQPYIQLCDNAFVNDYFSIHRKMFSINKPKVSNILNLVIHVFTGEQQAYILNSSLKATEPKIIFKFMQNNA